MKKPYKTDPKTIAIACRVDPESAKALDGLAERKGMNRSDFLRGVVEKILTPIKEEDAAVAAEIEALPASARKKALRAIEIQKRLRELRAARPRVHALSSLFQDGDGVAQDAETVRLEAELFVLGKAFDAEVGGGPEREVVPESPGVEDQDEDDDAENGEEDEPEGAEEEAGSKTEAEEEADRYIKITELINSLRGCREKRSFLDNLLNGGPPACDLLIKELEAARAGAILDESEFEELSSAASRAIEIRKKILELRAVDGDACAPTIKKLNLELESVASGLRKAAASKKTAGRASGPSSWLDEL